MAPKDEIAAIEDKKLRLIEAKMFERPAPASMAPKDEIAAIEDKNIRSQTLDLKEDKKLRLIDAATGDVGREVSGAERMMGVEGGWFVSGERIGIS